MINPMDCHAPVKNIYDLFCFYLRQTPCPAYSAERRSVGLLDFENRFQDRRIAGGQIVEDGLSLAETGLRDERLPGQ
jgi:hypothetical protein